VANDEFDRDRLARWYAQRHYKTDQGIQEVVYLPTMAPEREIRLVEVNGAIAEREAPLEPIDFGVDIGDAEGHTLMVLDVTPAQWKKLGTNKLALPPGWSLQGSVSIPRRGRWTITNACGGSRPDLTTRCCSCFTRREPRRATNSTTFRW
jgi:hypothetical protein